MGHAWIFWLLVDLGGLTLVLFFDLGFLPYACVAVLLHDRDRRPAWNHCGIAVGLGFYTVCACGPVVRFDDAARTLQGVRSFQG